MIKDTEFYNKESSQYSSKRYPAVAIDYVQFFFKKRLDLTIRALAELMKGKQGLSLFEVGCADGIVVREIARALPAAFTEIVGVDIAPDMVTAANAMKDQSVPVKTSFYVRGEEPAHGAFDAVVEIGVANYTDFDAEIAYASEHLVAGGTYILSIAGKGSLSARFAGGWVGYENFLTYKEYEAKMERAFSIERAWPVGFRVPLIWKVPAIARFIQPILESFFSVIVPELFHEKIYLLKKR